MENCKKYPILCGDKDCTGCMACVNACAKGALSQSTNEEGFYRPSFNSAKCVMCGLCEKSCPVMNPPMRNKKEDMKVYAAWHLDEEVRRKSSSGGAFSALAEVVLEQDGIVAGAAYTEDMSIEHIAIENNGNLGKLRLSKYAQSRIGGVLFQIREYLKAGRKVLFIGTACQAAGLKSLVHPTFRVM